MSGSDIEMLKHWSASGNADAFAELVRRYAPLVYSAALRVLRNQTDAEDVAQQCFLELAQHPPSIHTTLAGWLHRLATHRALNHLRGEKRRSERERQFEAARVAVADQAAWGEISEHIDEAIAALRPPLRDVIARRFLLGESAEEVAKVLDIAPRTVRHRQQQGVEAIRSHLRKRGIAVPVVLSGLLASGLEAGATPLPEALGAQLGKLALSGIRPAPPALLGGPGAKGLVAAGAVLLLAAAATLYGVLRPAGPEGTAASPESAAASELGRIDTATEPEPPADRAAPQPASSAEDGPAPEVSFTVAGPDAETVSGASLIGREGGEVLMTTDDRGTGDLTVIPTDHRRLRLHAEGYEEVGLGTLPHLRQPPVRVETRLWILTEATVRVLAPDGAPVANTPVIELDSMHRVGMTDGDGRLTLVYTGATLGFKDPSSGLRRLEMSAAEGQVSVARVQPSGGLRIQVLQNGQPAAGVTIYFDGVTRLGDFATNEDGVAVVERVPVGEEHFVHAFLEREGESTIFGTGFATARPDEDTECTIVLGDIAGTILTGKVVWEDGAPFSEGTVLAARTDFPLHFRSASTRSDGSYQIALFPGGNIIRVGGLDHGGLLEAAPVVTGAKDGTPAAPLRLVVRRPEELPESERAVTEMTFRLDFAGRPRPKEVMVFIPNTYLGAEACWIATPEDGLLRLGSNAASGEFDRVLVADREGGFAGYWQGDGPAGTRPAPLRLDIPVGTIRGTLTDQAGNSVPYGTIQLRGRGWPGARFQTDRNGDYAIWPVPLHRELTVSLQAPGCFSHESQHTFAKDGEDGRLKVDRPDAKIAGNVYYEDGTPAPRAAVNCQAATGEPHWTRLYVADGAFEGALTTGTWNLTPDGDTGPGATVAVQVPATGIALYLPGPAPVEAGEDDERMQRTITMAKQLGLVFKMFANEAAGEQFPAPSTTYGNLSPDAIQIFPEYLTDPAILAKLAGEGDARFCYLGYAVANEEDGQAFLDAYESRGPAALVEGGDLMVARDGGGSTIHRLREGVERITGVSQSEIPVLWEVPQESGESPTRATVLFMDGHVEQREYPGEFPMTEGFIGRIRAIQGAAVE